MRTADIVFHRPTGETWLVAYVHGEELCPCGWPESFARVSDCDLVRSATEAKRLKLLYEMAKMTGNDSRGQHARWELAEMQRQAAEVHE